jgi:hypothetical protein
MEREFTEALVICHHYDDIGFIYNSILSTNKGGDRNASNEKYRGTEIFPEHGFFDH